MQYELSLYEIGGNEPVDLIDPRQVSDADAIVLVFSLASPDALQQLRFYQARLAQIAPEVPIFFVGMLSVAGGVEEEQLLAVNIEEMIQNWGIRAFWKTTRDAGLNVQGLIGNLSVLPRSAGKTAMKIVFVGPAGGGKSALIARLANAELTGAYTPTARSRMITVRCDVPAIAPVEGDQKSVITTPPVLDKQVVIATEEEHMQRAAAQQELARHEMDIKARPYEEEQMQELKQIRDDMLREKDRLKHTMESQERLSRDKSPARPSALASPGAPGVARGAEDRDKLLRDLKEAMIKKGPAPSPVGGQPAEPSGPVSPSPVSAGGSTQPAPSAAVGEKAPEVPKNVVPATLTQAGESEPLVDAAAGTGAFFTQEANKSDAVSPQPVSLQPAPPLSTPAPSVEIEGTRTKDESHRDEKGKRKEAAKQEKKARERGKWAAEEDEELQPEMTESAQTGGEINGSKAAPTVTVEKVLERKTTVFYRKQMNPLTRNKLSVVLSTLKIYEQLKLQTIVPAERVGGDKTLKIKELSPFVHVQPVFPGCICVPAEMPLDARKDSDTADFHITPLATGEVMDACVRIFYEGKLVDTIQTPTKVVTQTSAKVSAAAAVMLPVFGPNIDALLSSIPFLGGLWAMVGGIENLFMYVAGALGVLGTIMYLIHRPRQAIPIEANFPELQKFLEEDVNQPGLGDVLKEKVAQEKMEQEKTNNP